MNFCLFIVICLGYLIIHFDDGIVAVASESILNDLKFSESQLGLTEAAVYAGVLLGSLVCPKLFDSLSPKVLVISGVTGTSLCVLAWLYMKTYWSLALARLINGTFLVTNFTFIILIFSQSR